MCRKVYESILCGSRNRVNVFLSVSQLPAVIGATHFLTHMQIHTKTQESHSVLVTEAHGSKQTHHLVTGYLAPSVGHTG